MNLRQRIKDIVDILMINPWWQKSSTDCMIRLIVSVVFAVATFILGIMDFVNGSTLMMVTSVVLVTGFSASAVVSGHFKRADISTYIIALLVCFVLSTYVVTGGNEGFAILWVLLVPVLAINVLGINIGFLTATYFLVFIFAMFYSPLNGYIQDKYTSFFISRFPVLYLSDYLLSLYLSFQKEYFSRRVHLLAYTDGLTGCYNRRFFDEQLNKLASSGTGKYSIIVMDINGLKKVNDTLGHEAGDELICSVPECYNMSVKYIQNSYLFRTGGDEFTILIEQGEDQVKQLIERITEASVSWKGKYSEEAHFAYGFASNTEYPDLSPAEILKKADTRMYENKAEWYRKNSANGS